LVVWEALQGADDLLEVAVLRGQALGQQPGSGSPVGEGLLDAVQVDGLGDLGRLEA